MRLRVALWAAGLLLMQAARAQDGPAPGDPALYQATAIVTGTDMRQRPLGFARCLTEVLVKLTGAPGLADDPRVAARAGHADALAAGYAYVDPRAGLLHHDDQGTYDRSYEMTVRFDPARVQAALSTLGVPPWRGPRPLLTPVILVRGRDPAPFLLSAETPRGVELRTAVTRLASEHGVGVHFPTEAEFAEMGVGLIGYPAPLGAPEPGRMRVAGSLSWNVQAMGWVGTWRVRLDGVEHDWTIGGVGFDQAFAAMVRGAVMLAAATGVP